MKMVAGLGEEVGLHRRCSLPWSLGKYERRRMVYTGVGERGEGLGYSFGLILFAGNLCGEGIEMGLDGCGGVNGRKMEVLAFYSLIRRYIDIPLMGMQVVKGLFPFIGILVLGIFLILGTFLSISFPNLEELRLPIS